MTLEPTLHDIAVGTTGCGDDDDAFDEEAWSVALVAGIAKDDWTEAAFIARHQHDDGCYGTLEHSECLLCGIGPNSHAHVYCSDDDMFSPDPDNA